MSLDLRIELDMLIFSNTSLLAAVDIRAVLQIDEFQQDHLLSVILLLRGSLSFNIIEAPIKIWALSPSFRLHQNQTRIFHRYLNSNSPIVGFLTIQGSKL